MNYYIAALLIISASERSLGGAVQI